MPRRSRASTGASNSSASPTCTPKQKQNQKSKTKAKAKNTAKESSKEAQLTPSAHNSVASGPLSLQTQQDSAYIHSQGQSTILKTASSTSPPDRTSDAPSLTPLRTGLTAAASPSTSSTATAGHSLTHVHVAPITVNVGYGLIQPYSAIPGSASLNSAALATTTLSSNCHPHPRAGHHHFSPPLRHTRGLSNTTAASASSAASTAGHICSNIAARVFGRAFVDRHAQSQLLHALGTKTCSIGVRIARTSSFRYSATFLSDLRTNLILASSDSSLSSPTELESFLDPSILPSSHPAAQTASPVSSRTSSTSSPIPTPSSTSSPSLTSSPSASSAASTSSFAHTPSSSISSAPDATVCSSTAASSDQAIAPALTLTTHPSIPSSNHNSNFWKGLRAIATAISMSKQSKNDTTLPILAFDRPSSEDERVAAFRLVTDAVAQQRQVAARALLSHPLLWAVYVLIVSVVYVWLGGPSWTELVHERRVGNLPLIFTTSIGIGMAILIGLRGAVGGYLKHAEHAAQTFYRPDQGDELVLARFGDTVIGAVVFCILDLAVTSTDSNSVTAPAETEFASQHASLNTTPKPAGASGRRRRSRGSSPASSNSQSGSLPPDAQNETETSHKTGRDSRHATTSPLRIALIRAWTVRWPQRGQGVGRGLLEHVTRFCLQQRQCVNVIWAPLPGRLSSLSTQYNLIGADAPFADLNTSQKSSVEPPGKKSSTTKSDPKTSKDSSSSGPNRNIEHSDADHAMAWGQRVLPDGGRLALNAVFDREERLATSLLASVLADVRREKV